MPDNLSVTSLRSILFTAAIGLLIVLALTQYERFIVRAQVDNDSSASTSGEHVQPDTISPDNPMDLPEQYNFNRNDLDQFNGYIATTLQKSEQSGGYAIIVDKASYTLYLVHAGEVVREYPVELGFNPVDDKRMEGDGCTPEGIYQFTEKRDTGQTAYYRGWMLNYPAGHDHAELARLKEAGEVPQDATVGSAIMLHGKGSGMRPGEGGSDWTLGCIALSNEQIDELFPLLPVGTRITIVRYSDFDPGLDASRP